LFLDEVGEIRLETQSKLLRVIQEGEFERIGEGKTRKVDVRIIAASNRDLKGEVEAGRFRQDLYYRLNVFPIEVAPLRHRVDDIPLLASRYLELAVQRLNLPAPVLTGDQMRRLKEYDWPGNVRELQNLIERFVITQRGGRGQLDLPAGKSRRARTDNGEQTPKEDVEVIPEAEMRRLERENTLAALKQSSWRLYGPSGAAELLGVKPTTLASRVKKMGLGRRD